MLICSEIKEPRSGPCYEGSIEGGNFVLNGATFNVDIDFMLYNTRKSVSAAICKCNANTAGGEAVCTQLGANLVPRLVAVKNMIENPVTITG